MHSLRPVFALILAGVLAAGTPAIAQDQPEWMRGLDELMTTEVSSVSRKQQRLTDTSAAVFVLSHEEIRRSGMTTVPDLLRLVPGVHVAQIDANKWAVTARGFNSRWSNKLLVMVDGRSIYTPYFAGVFWDAIDVPVSAIDRIEVIRGPGASIWGANAVNGVINIITTDQAIRRRTAVAAGAGSLNARFGGVTHRGRVNDNIEYRLFGDAGQHGTSKGADGGNLDDRWEQRIGGGWLRARLNTRDTVEVSARGSDSQSRSSGITVTRLAPFSSLVTDKETDADSWNSMFKWTRQLPQQGHLEVETYVDEWWRRDDLNHHRRTINTGLRHRIGLRGRHDFLWGAEYRRTQENTRGNVSLELTPGEFNHDLVSGYAQDEIAIAGTRGHVVLGTKVEHREFTGWGVQPTARLHWRFTPTRSAWTAVSRAFRAPDRVERGMSFPVLALPLDAGLSGVVTIEGNPDVDGEWLTAYEAGYRSALGESVTLDLAAYYNQYDRLLGVVAFEPRLKFDGAFPYLQLPLAWNNVLDATSAGGEAIVVYTPAPQWKITGGYTLFTFTPTLDPGVPRSAFEGPSAPRHQLQLRASAPLTDDVDLDATWFAVGRVNTENADGSGTVGVPRYTRLDARIAWRPRSPFEIALVGQNLTDARHLEFTAPSSGVVEFGQVPRSLRLNFGWHF